MKTDIDKLLDENEKVIFDNFGAKARKVRKPKNEIPFPENIEETFSQIAPSIQFDITGLTTVEVTSKRITIERQLKSLFPFFKFTFKTIDNKLFLWRIK